MRYGAEDLYTQWPKNSLPQWKIFLAAAQPPLFHETGVLWLGGSDDSQLRRTATVLRRCNVPFEEFDRAALEKKYPQVSFEDVQTGILETNSVVLLARRTMASGGGGVLKV